MGQNKVYGKVNPDGSPLIFGKPHLGEEGFGKLGLVRKAWLFIKLSLVASKTLV